MNKLALYITVALHVTLFIMLSQTKFTPTIINNRAIKVSEIAIIKPKKIKPQPVAVVVKQKPKTNKSAPIKKRSAPKRKRRAKIIKKQSLARKKSPKVKPATQKQITPTTPFALSSTSIRYLQDALILPKKGSVKVTITVQANGKIDTIELSEGKENQENSEYLRANLQNLILPGFVSCRKEKLTIIFSHSNK
jgi:hypothetical protein